MLYQLAMMKAGQNEQYMREGIEQRFEKIRRLLEYRGIMFTDDEFNSLGQLLVILLKPVPVVLSNPCYN